ncbi:MAG TPA: YbaB/EbfC family nucleoid-associated protein [Pirellulaceae bacterium]|nr:YbaB/EbfC family nucleoid-associated protein [Pirellulaceae bacterium]HMO93054.1 YbaB/EbfC family nucleoid-associated protein [Pirellulaceae bacterium]HMP69684.1 YbaB/EbfC family nucleoid-associated protein [Pirellulaceae bacterium]
MFKGLGNLASLMKQATELSGKMEDLTQELKGKRVTGSAGGGLVTVEADGTGMILKVTIDPVLLQDNDLEMIQDLLPAAINSATQKGKQLHMQMMQQMTNGLPIPGLDAAFGKMMGEIMPDDEKE